MSRADDRGIAFVLGVLAAVLLILEAFVRLVLGVVFFATNHVLIGVGAVGSSIVFVVIGLLIGFFALIGRSPAPDRAMTSGIALVVLAILGWLVLGFSADVLGILGGVLAFLAGVLFLVAAR